MMKRFETYFDANYAYYTTSIVCYNYMRFWESADYMLLYTFNSI